MNTDKILEYFQNQLSGVGVEESTAEMASFAIGAVLVITLAILVNWLAKAIISRLISRIVKRTPWDWDDILLEYHVFTRLSHLAPAFVISSFGGTVFGAYTDIVDSGVQIYILLIMLMVFSALLKALQHLFNKSKAGTGIPIKGFAQAIQLVLTIIVGILILSILFGRSPVYFLSGIGALTAVMLLIFRDALLGLVAGVMISVNQMIRVGDWIEMPAANADGDVIDVSLTTVKVRNWDRTITTIPSYDLISKSFKNWQGMTESGGRRIKRAIFIDMQSIQFVDAEMIARFRRIKRLLPYLEDKVAQIEKENSTLDLDLTALCNGRRLTNIGTFRAYCIAYLKDNPLIRKDMTFLVRHLAPTEHGLPLEIYVFTDEVRWPFYEAIQSDVFDHLLSVIGEFGLRVFQGPSGFDIKEAGSQMKLALKEKSSS